MRGRAGTEKEDRGGTVRFAHHEHFFLKEKKKGRAVALVIRGGAKKI